VWLQQNVLKNNASHISCHFLGGPQRNIKPGFYCSVLKAGWIRWVGHVAHIGDKKSTEF
jgi:hypothetical protein